MASEFLEILSEGALEELKQVEALVKSLATDIKSINSFKSSNTPSGADNNVKSLNESYKKQGEALQQISNLQKRIEENAKNQNKATQNYAMQDWKTQEENFRKEKKALEETIKQNKAKLSLISSLNKQRYSEESKLIEDSEKAMLHKHQEELKQIKAKQALVYSLGQQRQKEEAENAKFSRTGASSVIPGMGAKIADLKEAEKLAIANDKLANVYNKIQAKVNGMIPVYNNLQAKQALGLALSHKEEAQLILLTNRLNKYQEVLKNTDVAIGRHGREVGNYSKGTSNLAFSISQISRELPNFGQSFEIGVLSLTNNIGALIDGAKQVRAENEILKKSGKATKSVFSQILTSVFSWQTLLFIGIGLISKYSTEIFDYAKNLFKADKGIKTIIGSQEDLAESFKKGNENALKEVSTLKVLYETATNENLSREQRNRAVKKMQDLYPLYLQNFSNEEIMAGKAKIAYENLALAIFNKARASAIEEQLEKNASDRLKKELELQEEIVKARKEYQDQLKNPKPLIGKTSDIYGSNDNILATEKEYTDILAKNLVNKKNNLEELYKASLNNDNLLLKQASKYYKDEADLAKNAEIVSARETPKEKAERLKREAKERKDAQIKLEKDQAKEREQILKEQYEAELSNLEKRKEALSNYLENEKNFNKEEISAFKFGTDQKMKYALKLAQAEINIAELVHKEKTRIAKKDALDRNLNPTQTKNLLIPIDADLQKSKQDAILKGANTFTKNYSEYYKELSKNAETEADAFQKAMDKYKLTPEQEKELERINKLREKASEDVKNYISSFQTELGQNLGFDETFNFFFKMDEDSRTMFDKLNDLSDEHGEKQKATFIAIAEAAQEMFNFIANASQKNFDAEYSRLEKQKDVALQFAGESDSAKKKIEEDYEKRRKEIATREFKANQKLALANIAIDIAQAVAAATVKRWWQIPLILTLGAIQAGIVASQKVPEYWKGTGNALEGLALTQERGAEIITDKKGVVKDFGDNQGARLTMMEAGDKVYTAEQTKRMMFNKDLNNIMMDNGIGNDPKIVVNNTGVTKAELQEVMMNTLGSMPTQSIDFDGNKFNMSIKKGHSKTMEHQARITGMGLKIGR